MINFVGIIAGALLLMLMYLFYSAMKDGIFLLLYSLGIQKLFVKKDVRERIAVYLKDSTYFTPLSAEGKKKFIDRLLVFMINKEFIGSKSLRVTEEMKVLISASATQLTFGLTNYKLETLETIYIFPETFFLHKRSPEYKGATKGNKMFLSWKDFKEGYANPNDSLNLGLHEMTHALKLSLTLGQQYDKHFANRIEYWENIVLEKFKNPSRRTNIFLRSYANANPEEFFAVCVEAFFENPEQFKKELPEIFHLLTFLLNQNILDGANDYTLDKAHFETNMYNIPIPTKIKRSYKYSTNHWSIYILIAGCMCALPTFLFLIGDFIFPYIGVLLLFFCIGCLGLLQKRYFFERNILSGKFFVFYAYAGFGSCIASLLLWMNFFIPVSEIKSEKHKIISYHSEYSYGKGGKRFVGWRVELEDEFQFNNKVLTMGSKPQQNDNYIVFEYRYGIIGIKKVEGYYFTTDADEPIEY